LPSWVLRVNARFEAAHHLTAYRGAPEPVHGHSWRVEAVLAAAALDGEGMGFDFVAVRAALGELAARFDHRDVNTVPPFDRLSPTTERLAAWFYEELLNRLPGARLAEVTVWEGPDCSATYRP
jgi:6-pyruvoyltetrahydropterin/6-carboxytetrahydropterin synthase